MTTPAAEAPGVSVFLCISNTVFHRLRDRSLREGKKLRQIVNEILLTALAEYPDSASLSAGIRKAVGVSADTPRIHVDFVIDWSNISRFREAAVPPFNMQTCIGALLEMHTPPL